MKVHRFAAHVRDQKAEWAAKKKSAAMTAREKFKQALATPTNGNGHFKDAVVGEMARINEEMKKLGVQHDRLSGYLMDYAK